jgi:peptidoglycan hydrolase CwlO-like protein
MNTRWLLVFILSLTILSTLSSVVALVLVMNKQSDMNLLQEKISLLEMELSNLDSSDKAKSIQSEQISSTLEQIFARLNAHEQSLNRSVRELSERIAPLPQNN